MSSNITGDISIDVLVYPTIETNNGLLFESFDQNIIIQSKEGMLEINRASLNHTESGYHGGLSYLQEGKLDYSVLLKGTSPLGAVELKPPAVPQLPEPAQVATPPSKTIRPGEVIITKLADKMEATFEYAFKANKPVRDLSEEATIVAVLDGGETWSKTVVLAPPATKTGNFVMAFPVDLARLSQLVDSIHTEIGVAGDKLTMRAEIHVTANTDFGR